MNLQSKIRSALIVVSLTAIIYLFGLLFLKYHLNNLSLLDFRMDYIGNILNILIAILLIVGSIWLNYSKKKIENKKINVLIGLQIISVIALVFIFFVIKYNIINSSGYLFSFPIRKVYTGFLFIFSAFLQFYSMLFIWGIIFAPPTQQTEKMPSIGVKSLSSCSI